MPSLKFFSKLIAYFLLAVFIVLLITLLSLAAIIPPAAKSAAARYDIQLAIDNVDIGWMRGRVDIVDVHAAAKGIDNPATLQRVALDINLTRLLQKRELYIDAFVVEGLDLPAAIELDPENQLQRFWIAGIDPVELSNKLSAADTDAELTNEAEDNKTQTPPVEFVGWNTIALNNVTIDTSLQKNGQSQSVNASLVALNIGELTQQAVHDKTPISAQLQLQQAILSASGEVAPLAPGKEGHVALSIGDIVLNEWLSITEFLDIDMAPVHTLEGDISLAGNVGWWLAGDRNFFTIDALEVSANRVNVKTAVSDNDHSSEQGLEVSASALARAETIKLGTNPLSYAANQFDLAVKELSLLDANLEPPLDMTMATLNLALDQLNSEKTGLSSELVLSAAIGTYGQLEGRASGAFLQKDANGSIDISAQQINLTQFSGVAKNAIGKHIDKGALDFGYVAAIDKGILDSEAKIEAHQLGLSGDFGAQSNVVEELGMPLNAALNLLRDKDDTVRLTVPVKGDLADPQIKISRVVNKALLNGVKTAVMTQFGPLLALSALDKARNMAAGLQLKSVEFELNDTEASNISSEAKESLATIAGLLEKRPKIKLNVCGVGAITEIRKQAATNQEKIAIEQLATDEKNKIYALASGRAESVKEYLIGQGIEGKRLILCAPQIDSAIDATPRVAFSL